MPFYTVPGSVLDASSRRDVLKKTDGVIFVADSQQARQEANAASLDELEGNLMLDGLSLERCPFALQDNKRDLPTAISIWDIEKALNPYRRPSFEAVAFQGVGVHETVSSAWAQVVRGHGVAIDAAEARRPEA